MGAPAYIHVKNFKAGTNRGGSRLSAEPGTLWTLKNAHLNRNGDIIGRKKFVLKYTLPIATFGLHALGETIYTFGSADVSATVPAGVTYQRLQHPDGTTAMSALLWTENFDAKIYAIAKFADDDIYHFYDGTLVADWLNGVVRDDFTNNDGIASHLKTLIDADDDYSATVLASTITITGAVGEAFTIDKTVTNKSAGTDDQTLTVATTQQAVEAVSAVAARATTTITAGSPATPATGSVELDSGASGSVDSITVDGVEIMSGAESFDSDLDTTAANVATNINAHTSSPEYTATAEGAVITITAAISQGDTPNGFVVNSTTTTIAATDTNMAGGADSGISSITIDGVEILGSQVNLTGSHSLFATNLADTINNKVSSPEYTATADSATVTITAAVAGEDANGRVVGVSANGDVTTQSVNMAGGVDLVSGQAQISTAIVGGTFEAGDKFTVKLTQDSVTKLFGAEANPTPVAKTARTHGNKLYATADSLLHFSAVGSAIGWNRDNVNNAGANFINMSTQDQGSSTLYGTAGYQGSLAVFARRSIQIWQMDADEDLNTHLQTLPNTGTRAGKSVLAFGDNDVFYLSDVGVRSLRARDSSNSAFVNDVGNAIDPHIRAHMKGLTDAQVEAAVAILEPEDDRYWLALDQRIYVFSFFPGSKVSAWSYYDVSTDIAEQVTDLTKTATQVYARAGKKVYIYGGDAGTTYPSKNDAPVAVELPWLDAGSPATQKKLRGFHIGGKGVWLVNIFLDPSEPDDALTDKVLIGSMVGTTYAKQRQPGEHQSTHFAPELVASEGGQVELYSLAVVFDDPHEPGGAR